MKNTIAVRYNKKNVCRLPVIPQTNYEKIDLICGINIIDCNMWDELKKQPMVKIKIDKGILEEVQPEKKESKNKSVNVTDFSKMKPEEKKRFINECFKIKSLKSLMQGEKDADVRLIIENRIKTIKTGKDEDGNKIKSQIDHPSSHLKTN